jgi:hypothetical protein
LGLSAWKVILVAGVVILLFLPRFIRMGDMLRGLGQRFAFDGGAPEPQAHAYRPAEARAAIIDGDTGRVVDPEPAPAKPSLAERIGMTLGRLTRRVTQRLSA